jgi:hypothetical protein
MFQPLITGGESPPGDWFYNPLRPVSIIGDGPNATIIKRSGTWSGPLLRVKRPFATISGIAFDGANGTGSDAVIETGGAGGDVREINFRDCIIKNGPAHCLKVLGGVAPAPINILCSYDRCTFSNNGSGALVAIGKRDAQHVFRRCTFTDFIGSAIDLDESEGIGFYECLFARQVGASGSYFLARRNSSSGRLVGCTFDEDVAPLARQWFIELGGGCKGWSIVGCRFIRRFTLGFDGQSHPDRGEHPRRPGLFRQLDPQSDAPDHVYARRLAAPDRDPHDRRSE